MKISTHNLGTLILAAGAVWIGGCEKPPAIFDEAALWQMESLMILPLQSPQDPSAGPIAGGMIIEELSLDRVAYFTVREAPALWRLTRQDVGSVGRVSEAEAKRRARLSGADAILIGTLSHLLTIAEDDSLPKGMRKQMKIGDFQRHFGQPQAATTINLQILSVSENRTIYSHSFHANSGAESQLLRKVVVEVLAPLRKLLKKRPPPASRSPK